MKRIIILGLDGATWKVLLPLIDRGHLTNIARIRNNGATGVLESIVPPITGPAWVSMATGKNPGKTGVYDFMARRDSHFMDNVITSQDIQKHGSYWDILNKHGYRTLIFNHPMLYPPYKINGIMVSGIGAPEGGKITYPPEVRSQIDRIVENYRTSVDWNSNKYYQNKELLISDLKTFTDQQFKVVQHFLRTEEWDISLHVSSTSDFLQHVMWNDWINPESPYHFDFIEVWDHIDEKVGSLINEFEANVLIVSDHGFGTYQGNFLANKWLESEGFLARRQIGIRDRFLYGTLEKVYGFIKPVLARYPNLRYRMIRPVGQGYSDRKRAVHEIDFDKTVAYCGGRANAIHGAISIDEPDLTKREAIQNEIISRLHKTAEECGFTVTCMKSNELYWGDWAPQAPELTFNINDFACNIQNNSYDGDVFREETPFVSKTGTHRMDGIFMAYGPDIEPGINLKSAKIFDIAPTILHMMGVPVPADMDGRVLSEIYLKGGELASREIQVKKAANERERDRIRKLRKSKQI